MGRVERGKGKGGIDGGGKPEVKGGSGWGLGCLGFY